MDVSRDFVKAKQSCAECSRWFPRHYLGGGDYQELLDTAASGRTRRAGFDNRRPTSTDFCIGRN